MDAEIGSGVTTGTAIVVGAGPVGLVTALLLARHHVDVTIVDQSHAPVSQSRATDLHPATLERLAPFGITPHLTAIGQRIDRINVTCNDHRVGTYSLGRRGSPYPFALSVPQCTTEGVLQSLLGDHGITVRRGWRCVGVDSEPDRATAHLESVDDGRAETHTADWVIAADGANSTVRRTSGIDFPGRTSTDRFAVADVLADLPFDRSEMHLRLHRRGGIHVLPMPVEGYTRLFLDRWESDVDGRPETAVLAEIARDRLGLRSLDVTHERWSSSFVVHRRVASSFRHGRVLLVGDAAHLCTPVGGQGLNLGIADACEMVAAVAAHAVGAVSTDLVDRVVAKRRRAAMRTCAASWSAMRVNSASGPAASVRDAAAPRFFALSKRPVVAWLSGALD